MSDAAPTPPGWERVGGELHRSFTFPTFPAAIAFMAGLVETIEALDHHPRWENSWRTVEVWLTTHDAGGTVTEKDVALARAIDEAYAAATAGSVGDA